MDIYLSCNITESLLSPETIEYIKQCNLPLAWFIGFELTDMEIDVDGETYLDAIGDGDVPGGILKFWETEIHGIKIAFDSHMSKWLQEYLEEEYNTSIASETIDVLLEKIKKDIEERWDCDNQLYQNIYEEYEEALSEEAAERAYYGDYY